MSAILKVFNCYLLPNRELDGAETWWKALGQHGYLELLKWFCSAIQDDHHGDGMIDSWELEHLLGAAAMMWELLCLKISALLLYSTWTD